jgi:hypothetical protein
MSDRSQISVRRKAGLAVSAALILAAAGVAAHTALSSGKIASMPTAFRPLDRVQLPAGLSTAVRASAQAAGLEPSEIAEAGVSAPGSPYRATLVARKRGNIYLAFAASDLVTSFKPAASTLAGHPMVVLQGTGGTAKQLSEVGISIVVDTSVARVDVQSVNGKISPIPLTKWPRTPYASASISATVRGDFPKIVRAYNSAGSKIAEHHVDLKPAHF